MSVFLGCPKRIPKEWSEIFHKIGSIEKGCETIEALRNASLNIRNPASSNCSMCRKELLVFNILCKPFVSNLKEVL